MSRYYAKQWDSREDTDNHALHINLHPLDQDIITNTLFMSNYVLLISLPDYMHEWSTHVQVHVHCTRILS